MYAIREGAGIVTLGGFSSILLEGKTDRLPFHPGTAFTTGNTLTVALIVRGMERALALAGRDPSESNILIIGASGDVGSGCARCLAPRVKRLSLCARNPDRLKKFASEFQSLGSRVTADTDLRWLSQKADAAPACISFGSYESNLRHPSRNRNRLADMLQLKIGNRLGHARLMYRAWPRTMPRNCFVVLSLPANFRSAFSLHPSPV